MSGNPITPTTTNQTDLVIAVIVMLAAVYLFTFGLMGLLGSAGVLFLSAFARHKINVVLAMAAALIVASLVLHQVMGWTPQFFKEHFIYIYELGIYVFLSQDYNHLQNGWLHSFGYDPLWVLLHSAIVGSVLALLPFYHDKMNPMRAARRRQKEEQRREQAGYKKPTINNSDKKEADKGDATVLGNEALSGRLVTISDKSLNTHALVVGTTGGGKTVTVLNMVESFINRGLPVLYIDGKGDTGLGTRICDYARSKGRAGRLFSMVDESVTYNPLYSGSFTSKKDRIIEIREWSEPHYKTLSEGYLQMVFSVLEKLNEDVNFLNVAEYIKSNHLNALVRKKHKSGEISDKTADDLGELIREEKINEEHIQGLAGEIRNLARSELGPLFEIDKVKNLVLGESLKRGEVIYMGLNPLKFPAFAGTLGKLIVNDFKSGLDTSKPQKVLVVFDEFGVFAGDQVLNIINQGRSAGVCAVLTVQSTSDIGRNIQNNSEQFIEQVFSNCNNYIIHRVNSATNAEALAAIVGTKVSQQLTTRMTDGTGFAGEGSLRDTREYLHHPDKIKNLRTGDAIYLDRNTGFDARICVRMSKL